MLAQDATFIAPEVQWWHVSPLIALVAGALFLLVVGALTPRWPRGLYGGVAALTAATSGALAFVQWHTIDDDGPDVILSGALAFDHLTQIITITICA